MKMITRLLILAALIITACAPTATTTPPPESASVNTDVVGSEGGLYPPQDLALVSSTGRPQFIHSYADWCTTCQHNHPIVQELMTEFDDQIDFIHLNIDLPETLDIRTQLDLVQRSQYLFIDAQGNILQKWFGFLDQPTVETYIQDYLKTIA
jgi:thiol-disulfide isomerase/thioredoxin